MVTVCVCACVRVRVCASCRKYIRIEQFLSRQAITESDMPYGITQCYLPPGWSDISAVMSVEAGTWLSDPGGMHGCVDLLHTEMVYLPEDGHSSKY